MASAVLPLTPVAVLDTPISLAGPFESSGEPAEIRRATIADAPAIHGLINANLAAGHLLPRTRGGRDAAAPRASSWSP